MRSDPFWPVHLMTDEQTRAYDKAYTLTIDKAGSMSRLASQLSSHTGHYISHQTLRNWRMNHSISVHWAMVLEDYTDGEADFFDFIPWMQKYLRLRNLAGGSRALKKTRNKLIDNAVLST